MNLNFGKASKSYDSVASIHQKIAAHLTKVILNANINISDSHEILDIGSGTGILSELLSRKFNNASITLNDISKEMLDVSKCKLKNNLHNFSFINADFEKINLIEYDFIVSSMSLHWSNDIFSFIKKTLELGKTIAFSVPILGTFSNWYEILKKLKLEIPDINYKSKDEMISFFDSLKLSYKKIEEKEYVMNFNSPSECARYLKLIGANISNNPYNFSALKKLLKINTSLQVSYKIFFAILKLDR